MWKSRSPTICHLQAGGQESKWYNSVEVQQPENWGAVGVNHDLNLSARDRSSNAWGQKKPDVSSVEKGFAFSTFSVYLGPHWTGCCSATLGRALCFIQFTIQVLSYSRNTLIDTWRINVLPALWVSFSPVNWHIKLIITGAKLGKWVWSWGESFGMETRLGSG